MSVITPRCGAVAPRRGTSLLHLVVAPWCGGYHYCTTSFHKAWTQVLRLSKLIDRRFHDRGNVRHHTSPWRHGYHYYTISFHKAWTQVLHKFKSCSRRVRDLRWCGSLTMVPARNKAKHLSSVSHTTETIYHHHHHLKITKIGLVPTVKYLSGPFFVDFCCREVISCLFYNWLRYQKLIQCSRAPYSSGSLSLSYKFRDSLWESRESLNFKIAHLQICIVQSRSNPT